MQLKLEIPHLLIKKFTVLSQLMPYPDMDIDEFFVQQIDEIVSKEIVRILGIVPQAESQVAVKPSLMDRPLEQGRTASLRRTLAKTPPTNNFAGLGDEEIEEDLGDETDDDGMPEDLRFDEDEEEEPALLPPKAVSKSKQRSPKSSLKEAPPRAKPHSNMMDELERELDESAAEDLRRPQPAPVKGQSPEDMFAAQLTGDPAAKAPPVPEKMATEEEINENAMKQAVSRRAPRKLTAKAKVSEYTGTEREI